MISHSWILYGAPTITENSFFLVYYNAGAKSKARAMKMKKEGEIMKRVMAFILILTMAGCVLSGCGSEEPAQEDGNNTVAIEEDIITLESGYWVAESMVMEGTEFSNEEMVSLFGAGEKVLSLAFNEEGKVSGVYFEEPFTVDYTGDLEGLEFKIGDETVTGSGAGEELEIKLADDFSIKMKYQKEMPEALGNNPWATYAPDFDAAQTSAMSNFMSYARYLVEDNVMYGLTHIHSNDGQFGATPFTMAGDFPEFGETTILDDRGPAYYIIKEGEYLYYLLDCKEVCRVKTDGTGRETLYSGPCDYLQLYEGRLYFTNEAFSFLSMELDGSDLRTEIEKEIYYPYFICEDWMVFQDDADGESLHLYNIKAGEELNITYIPSYAPVLDGHYLYYVDNATDAYYLNRIDMSNPELFVNESSENTLVDVVFMIDEVNIYSYKDVRIKEDWKLVTTDEGSMSEREMYISEDYTIYHKFDAEGYVIDKTLMSKETSGGSSFN